MGGKGNDRMGTVVCFIMGERKKIKEGKVSLVLRQAGKRKALLQNKRTKKELGKTHEKGMFGQGKN